VKEIEFKFISEFKIILLIFIKKELDGCCTLELESEKYLAKTLTISGPLLTTVLSKDNDLGNALLLITFLIKDQKYFGLFL